LTSKEFSTKNVLNSLSKTNKAKLEKFIDLPLISKEDFLNDKDKNYEKERKLKKEFSTVVQEKKYFI